MEPRSTLPPPPPPPPPDLGHPEVIWPWVKFFERRRAARQAAARDKNVGGEEARGERAVGDAD
jgi:hypothetical protein